MSRGAFAPVSMAMRQAPPPVGAEPSNAASFAPALSSTHSAESSSLPGITPQTRAERSRNALSTTDSDEALIAKAAKIGPISRPKNG